MKTCTAVIGAVVAAAMASAGPAYASEAVGYLGVYQDESAGACQFDAASASGFAYVVLTHSIPARELTFTAPKPDCIGTIFYESSPFATTGDSQTGITIDLGDCTTPPVTVLTILFSGIGNAEPCCIWPVGSYTSNPWTYTFVDCNGVTRQGQSAVRPGWYTCCAPDNVLTPYEPYPPDGATDIPTNVTMSWILPEHRGEEWLYLDIYSDGPGTGPRPGTTDYFTAYEPTILQPNTTYYWMVGLQLSFDDAATSDLWSFTTGEGPVSAEKTTWGRVKALYGE